MEDKHKIIGNSFSVSFPRCMGNSSSIDIELPNPEVIESGGHFIRIDFYSLYSPSHPERHMAYFDIHHLDFEKGILKIALSETGDLMVDRDGEPSEVPPIWRGDLPLAGYSRIYVSLWNFNDEQAEKRDVISSPPVYLLTNNDLHPMDWLQVAVTDKCNLKCPMCSRGKSLNPSTKDVSPEVLKALLEASKSVLYVGLQGLGEPLMHKDLPGIVKLFRDRIPEIGRIAVTTNGTLLNADYAKKLIDAGINNFTFSVDGASKATYEPLRLGANFEQVVANMKTTVACAKKSSRKDVWVSSNFTMGHTNLAEVPDYVNLAASIGLDNVHFFHNREYPGMHLAALDKRLLAEVQEQARAIAREKGLNIRFASSQVSRQQRCPFMSSAYMWLAGEVTACQRMEPPGEPWPTRILGNVNNQSLESIWNSEEARTFRRGVITGNYPIECRDCTFCDSIVC